MGDAGKALYSVVRLEDCIPQDHPLKHFDDWLERELAAVWLDSEVATGRSILDFRLTGIQGKDAVESVVRAMLLQAIYGESDDHQFLERVRYSVLFRWFINVPLDEALWSASDYQLAKHEVLTCGELGPLFKATLSLHDTSTLLSDAQFAVDEERLWYWSAVSGIARRVAPRQRV
ncbi:conserved hypothetical protein [gamma proteobacterium NOR5-3]|nr:conserved hypothetical protein [gamma proteobacterium NOR5-3]